MTIVVDFSEYPLGYELINLIYLFLLKLILLPISLFLGNTSQKKQKKYNFYEKTEFY